MIVVEYHPGGITDHAPGLGRAYQADSVAGTVTRWDRSGAQIASRPLDADETAQFARELARQAVDGNRTTIEDAARAFMAPGSPSRDYLALATPTAAQTAAQAKRNARAIFGIIRVLLSELDSAD
jgi:fructose-specific component phosphotransferase system IIB-like protein